MGACYNTILVPRVERETVFAGLSQALHALGHRLVYQEEPATYEDGFHYHSVQMIFIGPPGASEWLPLASWGDGLAARFPDWYRANPLARELSRSVNPVLY